MRRGAALILLLAVLGASIGAAARASAAAVAAGVPRTGNLLILLDQPRGTASVGRTEVMATVASYGARLAGRSVPQIGLITVRPPAGVSLDAFAGILRALPGVASVQAEHRYVPRLVPNDPALRASDPYTGVVQWTLAREDFYSAWNVSRGNGALVGVIDTGIDATHPDLRTKLAVAPIDQQSTSFSTGPADTDQEGHGTHVASLACADTNNGIGMAGAGYNCKLVVEKTDFTDSSIDAAIVDATDHHADAINMSFGPDSCNPPPASQAQVRALDYAAAHKVVLVAAAQDNPCTEQGNPSNVLQPAGTGPDINAGIGLDVTAADFSGGKASFAGYGGEISVSAFGAFEPDENLVPCAGVPAGIFGAYPGNTTQLEGPPDFAACRVTFQGDDRYATLAGTSMAAPQVAAVGAMIRVLNPFASLQDILRIIKETAQRPPGTGWTGNLGWGILDAGAALHAAQRLDRLPPVSRIIAPRITHKPTFRLFFSGHDRQYPGLIASGIAYFEIFVSIDGGRFEPLTRTREHSRLFHGRHGYRYRFYSLAVDRAGNRERHPVVVRTVVL